MTLAFSKLNGAGNDFVIVDNRDGSVPLSQEAVARICDRRRGVGADGFIAVENAEGYDFFMRFFNSNGTEAEMCGNGSRCVAYFAAGLGLGTTGENGTRLRFSTGSGDVDARVRGTAVQVRLMDACGLQMDVPVQVALDGPGVHFMTVGTRHVVVLVEDAEALTDSYVNELGRSLRYDPAFGPIGANVNFISRAADGKLHIRTYEKGVEAETHACGTGSVACAVALAHLGRGQSPETVVQRGGEAFRVAFELRDYGATSVDLEGPVAVNFKGTILV